MPTDNPRWKKKAGIDSPPLQNLETAWREWAKDDGLPKRDRFDPMHFPDILPWVILSEVIDQPSDARPYDLLFRYVGTEFARYFNAQSITRMLLSEVGPPYVERWFAVSDAVRKARGPCYFKGAPIGTGYEYIALEMLALPLAKIATIPGKAEPETGFVLFAFARTEELLL